MQDPYSAMMSSQQRSDPYKTFQMQRQNSNNSTSQSISSAGMEYMHGLNYGSQNLYNSMTMGHEFNPLPAHMGSSSISSGMNSSRLSHMNPSAHSITSSATSATSPNASSPPTSSMPLSNISSPGPSTSRLSMSPEGHGGPGSQMSNNSHSPGEIPHKVESLSDSNSAKSGNEDDSGIPPKKRSHLNVPEEQRDDTYWEKRKKNNESAKRSREARRMKEEQIALRVVYLEQENLQLRTEVSLLKSEIEKLRCMLYNS